MTDKQREFVDKLALYVMQFAPAYDIRVCSAIIAQGILESAWGESKLAKTYHNYFGLKCGTRWRGKSVNLKTKEEYTVGTITEIRDNFRVYGSMKDGVKGYFDFLQLDRYQNLKGVTDPAEYLRIIKADGYATASDYVADCMAVVDKYDLTKYDPEEARETAITEREVTLLGHGSGNPEKHNLYTYTARRQAQTAPNGLHKGIVAVRRPKGLTEAHKAAFKAKIAETIGRNKYSQDKRSYVYKPYTNGSYYSDCSAIGMETLRVIGLKFGWLYNTAAIYTSSEFDDVPVCIKDGHIVNPEILRSCDAVLYRGNDPKRPKQIGHVEWVIDTPAEDQQTPKTSKAYAGTWPSLSNGRQGAQKKGFYQYGDGISSLKNYPTQIKRCQMVLNWLDDTTADLAVDGKFGKQTKNKVNVCRKALGLQATSVFDADLLERAKAFRK